MAFPTRPPSLPGCAASLPPCIRWPEASPQNAKHEAPTRVSWLFHLPCSEGTRGTWKSPREGAGGEPQPHTLLERWPQISFTWPYSFRDGNHGLQFNLSLQHRGTAGIRCHWTLSNVKGPGRRCFLDSPTELLGASFRRTPFLALKRSAQRPIPSGIDKGQPLSSASLVTGVLFTTDRKKAGELRLTSPKIRLSRMGCHTPSPHSWMSECTCINEQRDITSGWVPLSGLQKSTAPLESRISL